MWRTIAMRTRSTAGVRGGSLARRSRGRGTCKTPRWGGLCGGERLEERTVMTGELLKLELNARTANDDAFLTSQFNPTTRQLTIGVGEIFNLEVRYRDLRVSTSRIGASAIYADLLYDAANANALEPVLTETQFLELSGNLFDASTGTIDFTYPNKTSVVSILFDDFELSQTGSIKAAIEALGYANVSVQALARNSTDPFRYQIRHNDFALADQDIPNLSVTPRLDVAVASAVTDVKPRNQDGSLNSLAVPLNINFRSRTLPPSAGSTFFGAAGTQVGSFSAATGFTDVGATGPLLTTGWPQLGTGTPLPNPFVAFSIPARMTKNVVDMRLVIDPPNTATTANRLYGRDEPIPSSQILIETANTPNTAVGDTGVIFITATGGQEATVTLAVSPASVAEDGTTDLVYTFTRTGSTTSALTVNYGITGTADAADYTGATPGSGKTITFAVGASTATLTIVPTTDTAFESDETVILTLATGTGYTIGTSTPVTGTITNDDAAVPAAPTKLAGSPRRARRVALSWKAPTSTGGTGIIDYVVESSSDNGTTWVRVSDGVSARPSATVTGLVRGRRYVFRVAAVNDAGNGAWSAVSTAIKPW